MADYPDQVADPRRRQGYLPFFAGILEKQLIPTYLPERFSKTPEQKIEQIKSGSDNPRRFIDKTHPEYQESIYAEPTPLPSMDTGDVAVAGQIRGLAKPDAFMLRKVMRDEIRKRGPKPTFEPEKFTTDILVPTPGSGRVGFTETVERTRKSLDQIYSDILRGTWFRGQSETPKVTGIADTGELVVAHRNNTWRGRPDLRTENPGTGNVGEPRGISLSYDPKVSRGFAAEYLKNDPVLTLRAKADKLARRADQISREVYAADDAATKAGRQLTEEELVKADNASKLYAVHNKMYKRAAEIEATPDGGSGHRHKINRMMPLFEGSPEAQTLIATKPEHGAIINEAYKAAAQEMLRKYPKLRSLAIKEKDTRFDHLLENFSDPKLPSHDFKREFNEIMTADFQNRGFKAMLHSPHRYNEFELRVFDPRDVIQIDKRRAAVAKTEQHTYLSPWEEKSSVAKLRDWKNKGNIGLQTQHEERTRGLTGAHLYEWFNKMPKQEVVGDRVAKLQDRYVDVLKKRTEKRLRGEPARPGKQHTQDLDFDGDDFNVDWGTSPVEPPAGIPKGGIVAEYKNGQAHITAPGDIVNLAKQLIKDSGGDIDIALGHLDNGDMFTSETTSALKNAMINEKAFAKWKAVNPDINTEPSALHDTAKKIADLDSWLNANKGHPDYAAKASEINKLKASIPYSEPTVKLSDLPGGQLSYGNLGLLKKHAKQLLTESGDDLLATKKKLNNMYMKDEITGLDHEYLSKAILEHYKDLKKAAKPANGSPTLAQMKAKVAEWETAKTQKISGPKTGNTLLEAVKTTMDDTIAKHGTFQKSLAVLNEKAEKYSYNPHEYAEAYKYLEKEFHVPSYTWPDEMKPGHYMAAAKYLKQSGHDWKKAVELLHSKQHDFKDDSAIWDIMYNMNKGDWNKKFKGD